MDHTPNRLAALAMLAEDLRRTGQSPRSGNEEPNSLLEMLLNPDFVSPLNGGRDATRDEPSLYDDLPPLEDDAASSSPLPTNAAASEAAAEDDIPPLEDDPSTSASTGAVTATSTPIALSTTNDRPSGVARGRRLGNRGISDPPADNTDGAESDDSSMPSLQSVSDSSSEGDIYMSDSDPDWDDEEGIEDSDDNQPNLVTQIIEERERTAGASPRRRSPQAPAESGDAESDADLIGVRSRLQMYTELLDRARGIIPDLDARFQPPPEWVADLTNRVAGVDNDPKRAETLLTAMEIVPDDLVRRYEKLRTGTTEDVDGCAICRDDLLDKSPDAEEARKVVEFYAALPLHPDLDAVVAFPCAGKHLFHKDCLSPWLSRKTTCPTCRFDIDPLSLTLQLSRGIREALVSGLGTVTVQSARVWQPPAVESFNEWLLAEEEAQVAGVPRKRPVVQMPEYPPLEISAASTPTTRATPPRPARPTGVPFLADFLDTPIPDWDFDPETGTFDIAAAHRDIQEMHQRFLDADARRQQLETILQHLPAFEPPRTEVPPRSPSAPPVPPSEATLRRPSGPSPPPLPTPLFMEASAALPTEIRALRERLLGRHIAPRVARPAGAFQPTNQPVTPPFAFSHDAMAHLHTRPLLFTPTDARGVDMNIFTALERRHRLSHATSLVPAPSGETLGPQQAGEPTMEERDTPLRTWTTTHTQAWTSTALGGRSFSSSHGQDGLPVFTSSSPARGAASEPPRTDPTPVQEGTDTTAPPAPGSSHMPPLGEYNPADDLD